MKPSSEKPRYRLAEACAVAAEIMALLLPCCHRAEVAGSIRRQKRLVGDVEIVYIPRFIEERGQADLLGFKDPVVVNAADRAIASMEASGILGRRKTVDGRITYGRKNKLMVHLETWMPVDLFATDEAAWWNYLVCRTGPAALNVRIAARAKFYGWKWNPYGPGFTMDSTADGGGIRTYPITSEEQLFRFVGLPYLPPQAR